MTTFIFLAGMIALICLPVFVAIQVFNHQDEHQKLDYKKRRQEEKYHKWLQRIGLKETSFYFSPYGVRLLSIWGIATSGELFK